MNVQPVRNNSVSSKTATSGGNYANSLVVSWSGSRGTVDNKTSPASWTPDSCRFSKTEEHSTMSNHVSHSCVIREHRGVRDVVWRSLTGVTTNGEETWWTLTPAHCHVKGVEAVRTSLPLDWDASQTHRIVLIEDRYRRKTGMFLRPVNCLTAVRIVAVGVRGTLTADVIDWSLIACRWDFAVPLYFSMIVCVKHLESYLA